MADNNGQAEAAAAAARDHRNFVYSQTNDPNQRALADQNVKAAEARAGQDGTGGGFKMPAIVTNLSKMLTGK
jgi:hypothetical protein